MLDKLRFALGFVMVVVTPLVLVILSSDSYPNNLVLLSVGLMVIGVAIIFGWLNSMRPLTPIVRGLKLAI